MKLFKDNAGRAWTVTLNVDAFKRVRSLLGVDLMEALEGNLLERMVSDPVLLCDVIYAVCKPEADARGITDEDFGRAMAGDAIEQATTAFLEELVDFFPLARRRLLKKALEKLRDLEKRALEAAERRLESPELEAQMEEALRDIGGFSGNSPGVSGSIPDP